MKTSTQGLMAIISHEGIVTSRYKDSVGVYTIGVGHTAAAGGINPATFSGTITVKQALDLLREDIVKYENGVNAAVKVPLKQHQFDALVSFHFNTGAIGKAQITKTLNAGNFALAGKQFMNWVKPPEIKPRRTAEMNLFLTGEYPPAVATVYPASPSGSVLWSQGKRVNIADLLNATVPQPASPPAVVDGDPDADHEPKPSLLSALLSIFAKLFGRSA
jgi:lysozyme